MIAASTINWYKSNFHIILKYKIDVAYSSYLDYEVSTFDQLKMSKIQTERNYSVFNVCEEVRQEFQAEIPKLDHLINTKKNNLNYLVVDDEHRLLYCFVPKVASTNWLKFLVIFYFITLPTI